jgi:predicted MFS family arabinose efflux permease
MKPKFTQYQMFIVALLAFIQFTVVLDFMILSPLGAILLEELQINTQQFGMVVSAYAFSAGISGILTAGFADRFDRKNFLLFFYTGFVIGTISCGIAPTYNFLLIARVVTGVFGGVIAAIGFSIITDLFPLEMRGRAMGIVMAAFSGSQVMGIPAGLWLSNKWGWHAPFIMIAGISGIVGLLVVFKMKPVRGHLENKVERNALSHLFSTISKPPYLYAFSTTALLATGGFMLMPFASTFTVNNMGISLHDLPMIYMVTGLTTMITGPLAGRISDSIGKYSVFGIGSLLAIAVVFYYTSLGITALWAAMAISAVMFVAVSTRMIAASAVISAVPESHDRGAFMGINSSIQQLSGGVAAMAAGLIVVQTSSGKLEHYHDLGYVVGAAMLITLVMMYKIHRNYEATHK